MNMTAYSSKYAFSGKTAVITGASGLIGKELVRRFACGGAKVAAADIAISAELDNLVRELRSKGAEVETHVLDITHSAEIDAVFSVIEAEFGHIDILINNAGLVRNEGTAFHLTEEAYWKRIIEVNLLGSMMCAHRVLAGMIKRRYGKIINIASIAGVSGLPGWADYSASKGGLILFSKTLAMETGKYGITVNCVSPGMISEKSSPNEGTWIGRSGTPEDVANIVEFLASQDAGYITGSNYMVDGGRVAGPKNAHWEA